MRAIIVEDEHHAMNDLKRMVARYTPDIEVVGTAVSIAEAHQLIELQQPELLFLDVELGEELSFDLLRSLTDPSKFHIVFTTGHEGYAVEAFRFSAIDYLLKPIDPEDLIQAVGRVHKEAKAEERKLLLDTLLQNVSPKAKTKKIALRTLERIHIVRIEEIVRCESEGNYTNFFLVDGRKILVSKTIREYEPNLTASGFYRVHRSHLINVEQVSGFEKSEGGKVIMSNGNEIPISHRKKDEFIKHMDTLLGR